MGIKTYNPYTPSRRNMTGSVFSEITKSTPEKSLLAKKSKNAGRNNQGKITVRHHGGGNRQKYRIIDFKRNKEGVPAQVIGIEYDPNRTANIALICYADGEKAYILAPQGLTDGMTVQNGAGAEVRVGNCYHFQRFQLVLRYTTLNYIQVRVDSLFVLLETQLSLWLRKASMQHLDYHQAR